MKKFIALITFIYISCGLAFSYLIPKEIKTSKIYVQPSTGLSFPTSLAGLRRVGIFSMNEHQSHIRVNYQKQNGSKISIFIEPGEIPTEFRLIDEFLKFIMDHENPTLKFSRPVGMPVKFIHNNIIINGLSAESKQLNNEKVYLAVYECGDWLFKIRIVSGAYSNTAFLKNNEKAILSYFQPAKLVESAPLVPKSKIFISEKAMIYPLLYGCMNSSASRKSEWVSEDIDSLESISGYPGIYIQLHEEAIKYALKYADENKDFIGSEQTTNYLSELRLISQNNFIREFITDQYQVNFVLPKNTELNMEAYNEWKKTNRLNIDLTKNPYVVYFESKNKKPSLKDSVSIITIKNADSCLNAVKVAEKTNLTIVAGMDKANIEYIQTLCNKIKNHYNNIDLNIQILYALNFSNKELWTHIQAEAKSEKVLMLIPDVKYQLKYISGFGKPFVSISRKYTIRYIDKIEQSDINEEVTIKYNESRKEQSIDKSLDEIMKTLSNRK